MMNVYKRTIKIYLENEVVGGDLEFVLQDEIEVTNFTKEGNTFAEFWNVLGEYPLKVDCARWQRGLFSKKRRIEPWYGGHFKTWKEDGSTREWKVVWEEKEESCAMKHFKNFNAEKVIQYFKERGINSINL